ncbi:MAG: YodL domain-containing protein [Clostridia bacterium]
MKEILVYEIAENALTINCSELAEKNIKPHILDIIGYTEKERINHFKNEQEAREIFAKYQSNYCLFHDSTENANFWDITEYNLQEVSYLADDDFDGEIEELVDIQHTKKLEVADFRNNYEKITSESEMISLEGMGNGWFTLDSTIVEEKDFFLLENKHDEDSPYIIADENRKIIINNVWNGFDDLFQSLHTLKKVQDFYEYIDIFENLYNTSAFETYTSTEYLPSFASIEEMRLYGYTNMQIVPFLPLTISPTAVSEYLQFCKPYMLFQDNTEREVKTDYIVNIGEHNADIFFGFKKSEWLNYYNYRKTMDGIENNSNSVENNFLEFSHSFAIYQLIEDSDNRDYRFMRIDELAKANLSVSRDNYNVVYSSDLGMDTDDVNVILNNIYTKFNLDLPKDFHGHSLSVSDIIGVNIDNTISFHYVDGFGFNKLENFVKIRDKTYDLDKNEISNLIDNFLIAPSFEPVPQISQFAIYDVFTADSSKAEKLESVLNFYKNLDSSYYTEYGDCLDVIQSKADDLYFERSGQPFTISYEEIVNHIDVLINEDRYPHKEISIQEANNILSDNEELIKLTEKLESENSIETEITLSMFEIENISESCDFFIRSGAGNFSEKKIDIYKLYQETDNYDIIEEHLELVYSEALEQNSVDFSDVGITLKYENSMLTFTLKSMDVNMNFSYVEKKIRSMLSQNSYLSESEFKQYEEQTDIVKTARTGESVKTPRGTFSIVDISLKEMERLGYSVHHNSVDNKHMIMSNGKRTVAIKKEKISILERLRKNNNSMEI